MRAIGTVMGLVILLAASIAFAQGENPLEAKAKSTGKNADALVELGNLYVEAMQLDKAKRAYKEASWLNKKHGNAKMGFVRIRIAKGQFRPAKHACSVIARENPDLSVGEICSGWFWLSNDRSARAEEEFQKAIKKGDVARGKTGMAEAFRRKGDYDKAVSLYKEALAAGAGYVTLVGLGLTYEIKGEIKNAVQTFKKAMETQPASCLAHYHYGRTLGTGNDAIKHIKTALIIRPNWPEANVTLGNVYLTNKDFSAAKTAFEGAVKKEQGRGTAFYGLGRALHGLGKPKEAQQALKKAIELVPNLVGAYLMYADILFEVGDATAAVEAYEKARQAAPGDPLVYMKSGEAYYSMGRFTSARSFLMQAVSMNPNLSRAHFLLGDIACERRLYESGKQHYQQALECDRADIDENEIKKRMAACKPKR